MLQLRHPKPSGNPDDFLRRQLGHLLPPGALEPQHEDILPPGLAWHAALRLMLYYLLGRAASRTACAMAAAAGVADISHTTLLAVLARSEGALEALLEATVARCRVLALERAQRWRGMALMCLDATFVSSTHRKNPRRQGVHLLWEMTTRLPCQLLVPKNPGAGETTSWVDFAPGMLVLADRVYCTAAAFERAARAGAGLCARFKWGGVSLFQDRAMQLAWDPASFVAAHPEGCHQLELWARTSSGALAVRVCVLAMGEDWRREQARRAKKNKQQLSERSRSLLGHLVVVASLPPGVEPEAGELARLYRGRWAIEIEFKHMKSGRGLDQLEFKCPRKLRAGILGHLLGQALVAMACACAPGRRCGHEYEVRQAAMESLLQTLLPLEFAVFQGSLELIRRHLGSSQRSRDSPRLAERLHNQGILV